MAFESYTRVVSVRHTQPRGWTVQFSRFDVVDSKVGFMKIMIIGSQGTCGVIVSEKKRK